MSTSFRDIIATFEFIFCQLSLPWLEREQYDAISLERNSHGRCGYILCSNPLGTAISQTYRLDVRCRRVYDATPRKPFCSDWCFSAARHVRKQISKEPAWCRTELTCTNLTLLPRSARAHPGTLVLDALNRLRLSSDTSTSEEEEDECPSHSAISEPDSDDNSSAKDYADRDHKRFNASPISKQLPAETLWGVQVEPPANLVIVQQRSPVLPSTTKAITFSYAKERLPEPTNVDLFSRVRCRFCQWLSSRAFAALTRLEHTNLTGATKDNVSEDPRSPPSGSSVLPLVDSVSVNTIRRQLLMEELLPSVKAILSRLHAPSQSVIDHLDAVIPLLKFTNHNIHLSHAERKVVALTFLRLMANQHFGLQSLFKATQLDALLEDVTDRSGTEFINDVIDHLYAKFS
ncbi:unnamed protein product [Dicrocoelium dendriticum]|nr:unnamed protein product [Dicrocoelium dendriticum]